jgi:hypothetical protein
VHGLDIPELLDELKQGVKNADVSSDEAHDTEKTKSYSTNC